MIDSSGKYRHTKEETMHNKLPRLAALALVAIAAVSVGHGKSGDDHAPPKGPKSAINTTNVDGGGRSFG